jgi:hypothetical protein
VKPTAPRGVSNRLSCENRGPGLAESRVTAIAACRTCGTEPLERFSGGYHLRSDACQHPSPRGSSVIVASIQLADLVTSIDPSATGTVLRRGPIS